jgi:hypothetical protein
MRTQGLIPQDRPVQLGFALPGTKQSLKFRGNVVWQKHSDAGIRFAEMGGPAGRNLQLWLERQYLMG